MTGTRGRGRDGTTCGRGCGTGRGREHGTAYDISEPDTDNFPPPVSRTWEEDKEPQCFLYNYSETPGSSIPFDSNTTRLDLFYRYFTQEVWDLLATETNQYTQVNISHKPNAHAWNDVRNCGRMKALLV